MAKKIIAEKILKYKKDPHYELHIYIEENLKTERGKFGRKKYSVMSASRVYGTFGGMYTGMALSTREMKWLVKEFSRIIKATDKPKK